MTVAAALALGLPRGLTVIHDGSNESSNARVYFMFVDEDGDPMDVHVRPDYMWIDTFPDKTKGGYGVNVPLSVLRFLLVVQESLI